MLAELGQICLILALLVAILQSVIPLIGAQQAITPWMAIARPSAYAQLLLVLCAFAILTYAFVSQDFSLQYVAQNSNSILPWYYRYTAVWGAHEGSLLLWALILAIWTAAIAKFSSYLPDTARARVLAIMGMIATGFLSFLIFISNPFTRLLPAALEGNDLNPLLQDPGMIIHPPILYLGYVGFSVPFAFAIATLLDKNMDVRLMRWVRPWTNVAWSFLTIGIALGSWWAYYELGWGGWWFWDPVENASFMPWLVATALLHSQAVTEKRGHFTSWTLLLAITTFSLSLLGTFLVRSGVLTSVHAFASDPARGLFILIFLSFVIGGSLICYALHTPKNNIRTPFSLVSREFLILINNLLLVVACATVLLGTLYPLLADALQLGKISVGPPYFSLLFTLLMTPLVLLLPFGPLTHWQKNQPSRPLAMLIPWLGLSIGLGIIVFFLAPKSAWKVSVSVAVAAWVFLGTARFIATRITRKNNKFTAEMIGMSLAHFGVAIFLIGVLLTEALSTQTQLAISPGQSTTISGYTFRFDGVTSQQVANYLRHRGTIHVSRGEKAIGSMYPERRSYASGGQVMTEAAIDPGITRDLYISLGESIGNGIWAMRIHIKSFVRWIWFGAGLMALGGFITAIDRRFYRKKKPKISR